MVRSLISTAFVLLSTGALAGQSRAIDAFKELGTAVTSGDLVSFTSEATDPGQAHLGAAGFVTIVDGMLVSAQEDGKPLRVLDPHVELRTYLKNKVRQYRLTWSVRLVPGMPGDYHFDRRGTLLSGKTPAAARFAVEDELRRSDKVENLRRGMPNVHWNVPPQFVSDSLSGSSEEGYWYIKEFFLVAPK